MKVRRPRVATAKNDGKGTGVRAVKRRVARTGCFRALIRRIAAASIGFHLFPARLGSGAVFLRPDHVQLLGVTLLTVAPASPFALVLLPGRRLTLAILQPRAEFVPSQQPVDRLRPFLLAADFNAGRTMPKPNAGAGLLELLSSLARPEDKSFVHLGRVGPQRRQSVLKILIHGMAAVLNLSVRCRRRRTVVRRAAAAT